VHCLRGAALSFFYLSEERDGHRNDKTGNDISPTRRRNEKDKKPSNEMQRGDSKTTRRRKHFQPAVRECASDCMGVRIR
jgi:hypothetical protein